MNSEGIKFGKCQVLEIDHKNEINHFEYVSSTVPERIVVQPSVDEIKEYGDVAQPQLMRIKHFFEHYKDLEPNKWVKVTGWGDSAKARQLILESIERAGPDA